MKKIGFLIIFLIINVNPLWAEDIYSNEYFNIESNGTVIKGMQPNSFILNIKDLPYESNIAKGLTLGHDRFSKAIISSKKDFIAFAVESKDGHGWSGLYDFKKNTVIETAFFYQGEVTQLLFSLDDNYLAIEGISGGGFSIISFWNMNEMKPIPFFFPKSTTGFPADVRLQEWSDNGLKVSVTWLDKDERQIWLIQIQENQVILKESY